MKTLQEHYNDVIVNETITLTNSNVGKMVDDELFKEVDKIMAEIDQARKEMPAIYGNPTAVQKRYKKNRDINDARKIAYEYLKAKAYFNK